MAAMSTLRDLISNTSYFNEHSFVDVHYYVGKIGRMETVPFGKDIHERIGCAPLEFFTPKGVHLYGLLKHPQNGRIYAFISAEERDRVKAKWEEMTERIEEEKLYEDDTEWRVSYSPKKRLKVVKFDDEPFEWVTVYHNAFETNRRRH